MNEYFILHSIFLGGGGSQIVSVVEYSERGFVSYYAKLILLLNQIHVFAYIKIYSNLFISVVQMCYYFIYKL